VADGFHLRILAKDRSFAISRREPSVGGLGRARSGTVVAFRLVFPTSELAVSPELRAPKAWQDVIYVESAPPGKLTVLTLFVTAGEPKLAHDSEPSFRLASFDFGNGRRAQLIAHGEPENDFPDLVRRTVAEATARAQCAGVVIPNQAYGYFLGRQPDGCRYVFCAHIYASSQSSEAVPPL
jgi:hypothetical protein